MGGGDFNSVGKSICKLIFGGLVFKDLVGPPACVMSIEGSFGRVAALTSLQHLEGRL